MSDWGENRRGWRWFLSYALTPWGGLVLCAVSALVVALIIGWAFSKLGMW